MKKYTAKEQLELLSVWVLGLEHFNEGGVLLWFSSGLIGLANSL